MRPIAVALVLILFGGGLTAAADLQDQLCEAISDHRMTDVKRLIARGAELNGPCSSVYEFPLAAAAISGNPRMVEVLLLSGAKANYHDKFGYTAIYWILDRPQYQKDWQERLLEIAETLLIAGLNPNQRYGDAETPIMRAAYFGDFPMIRLLLRHGADINAKSKEGKTALSIARKRAHLEVVRALLDLGAK